MSEDKHICGSCTNKNCPAAGSEKYDGMTGPVIDCQKYKPRPWSLNWFVNWSLLFGLIAAILCAIHAIVVR